jgi:hypothetical protein
MNRFASKMYEKKDTEKRINNKHNAQVYFGRKASFRVKNYFFVIIGDLSSRCSMVLIQTQYCVFAVHLEALRFRFCRLKIEAQIHRKSPKLKLLTHTLQYITNFGNSLLKICQCLPSAAYLSALLYGGGGGGGIKEMIHT